MAAVGLALAALFLTPAPVAAAEPSIGLDRAAARTGDTVTVRLAGWPAGVVVTAALCGGEARAGSADCAVQTASSVSVPASGAATTKLRLSAPPVGCPCVVRATTAVGDRIAATPIDVSDVPDTATVVSAGTGTPGVGGLVVAGARVTNRWSLAALLGGPAQRTLTVELRNDGAGEVRGAELALDLGRAAGARAPAAIPVGSLAPGAQRRIEVPFTVAAPAVGRYVVSGRVDTASGGGAAFSAYTSCWPWLLAPAPVALALLVIAARRARRALRGLTPLRVGGIGLIGAGAACAAVLAAQTLLPGSETADAQRGLESQLAAEWAAGAAQPRSAPAGSTLTSLDPPAAAPAPGQPFAVLHVPRWRGRYTVVEGVSTADLRKGPGHYPGSALPGAVGNVAIAGHRGPAGLPFNEIDKLRAGDPVVIETAAAWYVYRVQRHLIVAPSRVDVVAPTPERPGVEPTEAMLTLTACHPRFSSKQRYISFSKLDQVISKATGQRPAAL